jgi:Domain of unknown function (DUF4210)/Chromosome segregation during meiosis
MAICPSPDEEILEIPQRDSGIKATSRRKGTLIQHVVDAVDADGHTVEHVELPRQHWPRVEVTSRAQLIESIKRGESPTWLPNPALEALCAKYNPSDHDGRRTSLWQGDKHPSSSVLEDGQSSQKQSLTLAACRDLDPAEIERPRSALHTGDFFDKCSSDSISHPQSSPPARSSSSPAEFISPFLKTPWYAPAIPSFSRHPVEAETQSWTRPINTRSRAPSLGSSLSSSFVFRPPTSPLVHAASNTDLDLSVTSSAARQSPSPERVNRRRTLPPESFHSFQAPTGGSGTATNFSRPFMPPRRESSLPYQAHQPRRSLTSISMNHLACSPQTPPSPRSRRPSVSSDHSPIHHASMVGSFEESILRGRMSTAPSKPLDFVAQIGVLGRGDCKPNLRCPAHVSVPFPAVFYNYPSVGNRSFSDDSPSPYVGTIDLEHSLKPIETKRVRKRVDSPAPSVDALMKDVTAPENTHIGLAIDRKKRERQRKRSISPKGPLGGCYRVPQQGQLQIVIKNPNKTAVKLYLVPYSLDGMEAGTKTFVRQRSFSAGPIMEKPLTDNPQTVMPDPLQHKSILRYLIHLKFCCPSKGRYYLYDNIRVVFANCVPDGKESLRNEVQVPEPRYSCYRPGRESSIGSAGAKLAAEKASRRRSSGSGLRPAGLEAMDGLSFTGMASTLPADGSGLSPFSAITFHPSPRLKLQTQTGGPPEVKDARLNRDVSVGVNNTTWPTWKTARTAHDIQPVLSEPHERTVSPTPGFLPSTSTRASPVRMLEFGRVASGVVGSPSISRTVSPTPSDCSEGLLTRELRSIDAHKSIEEHA